MRIGMSFEGVIQNTHLSDELSFYFKTLQNHGYDVEVISSRGGKTPIAVYESLDVYTDNKLTRVVPLIGKVRHLLLVSRPENEYENIPEEVVRVCSWYEIYNYIRYDT